MPFSAVVPVSLSIALAAGPAPIPTAPFPHEEATVAELQARMTDGSLSSVQLTADYLDRIAAYSHLNAVLEISPTARRDAELLDEERRNGQVRGPMHGIPVLIKGNILAVGLTTTAGSLIPPFSHRNTDSTVVRHLRQAGAVVLGSTNLSEWAGFRGNPSVPGWSARGGQTHNPYRAGHHPCGSSSGSAVAATSNLASVTLGTETDGSIICPASMNGVVGYKPTWNASSGYGVVPLSSEQDIVGPITRTIQDAVLVRNTIHPEAPPLQLEDGWLDRRRIGVLRGNLDQNPKLGALFDQQLEILRQAGAQLIEVELPGDGSWREDEFTALAFEFKDGITRFLRDWPAGSLRSLDDLIQFNIDNAEQEMPLFGQELFEFAASKGEITDPEYRRARQAAFAQAGPNGLARLLRGQNLDALVAPASDQATALDAPLFTQLHYSAPAVAGYPSITVPMGDIDGMPVGMLFIGYLGQDEDLLSYAYDYETRSRARRPPPAPEPGPSRGAAH